MLDIVNLFHTAYASRNWALLVALVIWLLIQLSKTTLCAKAWDKIPAKYQQFLPAVLGLLSGIVDLIIGGKPWLDAIITGVVSGLLALGGDQAIRRYFAKSPEKPES